jgi:hypothetical protein
MSLLVGKELFEVSKSDISKSENYLMNPHPNLSTFLTQCKVGGLMRFKPHSTTNPTHKKLVAAISSKHQKKIRTRHFATMSDPEKVHQLAVKVLEILKKTENDVLKAKRKLENQQRQLEFKQMMSEDVPYDEEESNRYREGDANIMQGFDDYEQDEDDGFSIIFIFIIVDNESDDGALESRLQAAKSKVVEVEKPKRMRIEESDSE